MEDKTLPAAGFLSHADPKMGGRLKGIHRSKGMNGGTSSRGWRDGSVNKRPGSTGTGSGFIPQISLKKQGMEECMYDSRKGKMEGRGSWMPRANWPGSLV